MNDDQIKRINELYKKSKKEGLTEAEKEEQAELRQKYINAIRSNLRGTLNNVEVKNPDGTITKLKSKK